MRSPRVRAILTSLAVLGAAGFMAPRAARAQQVTTLEEALRTALTLNPNVESSSAAAAAATSSRWADWGAFLPTIDLRGSLSQTDFTTVTFVDPTGVSQELEDPITSTRKSSSGSLTFGLALLNPERIANVKAGNRREDAAQYRLTATERTVIRDVKRSYFEALKQNQLLEVSRRQLEARRQDLDVTEQRYRIAAASRSDLLGAQIDLSDAELRVLDSEDALSRALRQLQVTLGVPVTNTDPGAVELVDVDQVPDARPLEADVLVSNALRANPNLLALQMDREAAGEDLWSAKAAYLPRIDIGYTLGRSKELGRDESLFDFSPANTSDGFVIQGSWSLFSGFTRKRQTAQADRAQRQAAAQLTAEQLQIEKDVRDLVKELKRRSQRLEILERNVLLAGERLDLAREQYRLGSIPYFNLQQAIDRLTLSEQALFQERYDYLIGWANLEEKVGGNLGGGAG
ncbi:MAG: TolC family protein [marine benthic group bacterium]|nr:TolC family protein [Candidatus Benthicola marisminoris]